MTRPELRKLIQEASALPWTVDGTKALGAYGIWTDYAVNPGWDGAGYPVQICSMLPMENTGVPVEVRGANAALITAACNSLPGLLDRLDAVESSLREMLAYAIQEDHPYSEYAIPDEQMDDSLLAAVKRARRLLGEGESCQKP